MTVQETDRALVQAAGAVARLRCRSERHTVAAAARTPEGRVISGVNLRHFTGGPCAEIVALATAATQGITSLETIVAVGDRGRAIVPPCGRCRQVLLDQFPQIRVILGSIDDPRIVPITDLLPEPPAAPAPPAEPAATLAAWGGPAAAAAAPAAPAAPATGPTESPAD